MKKSTQVGLVLALTLLASSATWAQSISLQEMGGKIAENSLPKITIYQAKEIVTLEPAKPKANAVAVVGSRILATGSLDELKAAVGE